LTHYQGDHDMSVFGERLQAFRKAAGLSQSQLARVSGVPVGTIRDYEQNRREPSLETAATLARAVGQPLDAFVEQPAAKQIKKEAETPPAKKQTRKKKGEK
jgi:transcriptional regulator with XRE-family HTH domain